MIRNIDLSLMQQFFKGLEEICYSFCQNQQQIDRAFNDVQSIWRDKNAVITCVKLEETAHGISRFYESLNEAIEYIVRYCDNCSELIDYERITPPRIEPFTIKIMEITNMEESVINTDPDALEQFQSALDKYIESIVDNTDRLKKIYAWIGESWDDNQYVKFGDALSAFTNQMQAQVNVLDRISAFLKSRIEILRRGDI